MTASPLAPHRLRPGALGPCLALALATVAAASCSHRPPPGAVSGDRVRVATVPPDACVAYYGPGPCREHGRTVEGSTAAVAGPPPARWHGAVRGRELPPNSLLAEPAITRQH